MAFASFLQEVETQVLSKEAIDRFTKTALSACLNLVDTLPDTVYRVCDLLITITKRNGEVWRDEMLDTLVADVSFFSLFHLTLSILRSSILDRHVLACCVTDEISRIAL
jgi:E3 ubiquitin-protein ligase HUWE1